MKQRLSAKRRLRSRRLKQQLCKARGVLFGALAGGLMGHAMLMTSQYHMLGEILWLSTSMLLGAMFGHATNQLLRRVERPAHDASLSTSIEHSIPTEHVVLSMAPSPRVTAVRIEPGQDLLEVLRAAYPPSYSNGKHALDLPILSASSAPHHYHA